MTLLPTTRAVVLGAASGALYAACQPPLGVAAVAFVALVPLLRASLGGGVAEGALAGWVAGTVACNGLTSPSILAALRRAGHPPWLAAAEAVVVPQLYGALWFAAFGAYAARGRRAGVLAVLVLPAAWVTTELARSRLGDGMPWVLLAHAPTAWPLLLQVADATGAYGISFVVAAVNVAVALATLRPALVAGALLATALVYGRVQLARWTPPHGDPVRVAVVQGAIPDGWRTSLAHQRDAVARYRELVARAARESPALVVLPENAVGVTPAANPDVLADIVAPLAGRDALVLVGGPRVVPRDGGAVVRNAVFLVDAAAAVRGIYDKRRLVPFGETPPKLLPAPLRARYALPNVYAPGEGAVVLGHGELAIAPVVCWEGIYAELVNPQVAAGATLLASLSNDDWFGGRAAVQQHFRATLLRAVETRRWVVRATNTGVTAIVDPRGVATIAPAGEPTLLAGTVALERYVTPYVRYGDVFAWGCVLLAVAALPAARRVGRREACQGPRCRSSGA